MRASQILLQDVSGAAVAAEPAGWSELVEAGYVVPLGAGLIAGTPLLRRVLVHVEDEVVAALTALGALEVALPATEGQALVNLAARCGRLTAARPLLLLSRGAGFREEAPESRGLFEAHLYARIDLVRVADGPEGGFDLLRQTFAAALRRFDLPIAEESFLEESSAPQPAGGSPAVRLLAELDGGRPPLGGLCRRALDPGHPEHVVVLAHLDLFAVVGALAARHRDARGLRWPSRLAPFLAAVLPAGDAEAARRAEKLASALEADGLQVLLDERDLDPAVKRRDAERMGLPARILCGPEALRVVFESRDGGPPRRVPLDEVGAQLDALLGARPRRPLRRRATY